MSFLYRKLPFTTTSRMHEFVEKRVCRSPGNHQDRKSCMRLPDLTGMTCRERITADKEDDTNKVRKIKLGGTYWSGIHSMYSGEPDVVVLL